MNEKDTRLEKLQEIIKSCRNCILGSSRKKPVFGEGPSNSVVLTIGEAPGREENETGRPFVGRAGKLLRKMLLVIGLDPEKNVFIANILKCRPPNNRPPEQREIDECINFLKKQIEIISPEIILLLGRTAVKGLFPEHTKTPLDILRKESKNGLMMYNGIRVLVTYHPSALLRDPSRRVGAHEDFTYLKDLIVKHILKDL